MDGYPEPYYGEIFYNKKNKSYEIYKTISIEKITNGWKITSSYNQKKEFLNKNYKRIKRNLKNDSKFIFN